MRSVVAAASLLAASLLLAPPAAAQDPDSSPPPPASADAAASRAPAIERVPGANRAPDAPRVRAAERAPDVNGTADRAVERPIREPRPDAVAPSRRVSSDAASVSVSDSVAVDEQRGERRGSVRRPPQDRGRAVDRAVPRASVPPARRTTTIRSYPYYYYPNYARYYDPWGYGSFGLGYFYYSPWAWGPSYAYGYGRYGYYAAYGGPWGYDIGSVRIKVRPRDAEVWVDGYYAGTVDDFDGVFQALKLDSGPYRIEIRKPGFETLSFDVRVQPDRTITFRGDLRPVP